MKHLTVIPNAFQKSAFVAALVMLAAGIAPAQAPDAGDVEHGVARISLMDGQVSVKRGDAGEWVAGIINAPLMSDDSISTAPNSRAEVQFDSSNILRIGGNAQIHLTTLEAQRFQMELAKGTVTYRVLRPSSDNAEVDTPSISVRPSKLGIYRISVNDAGETQVTVRAGDVEVFTPKGSQWIEAGQTMMARGSNADPEFQVVAAIGMDEWDRWNDSRDQALTQASAAYQYVPPGVSGVEDLQGQGNWVSTPDYGNVWQPTAIPAGWAPYSCGRWAWTDWYGWTWIDCASWGWAPFHYGRWFHHASYGWCWYPGVIGVRHYWSPGLVAFFGWGNGFGFGFGFGNVGWVPLAPYEVLHPWWGHGYYGAGFASHVNVTNINVYNNYRNARVMNGVSGVTAAGFRSGQFGSITHASGEQIRSAGLVRGEMPIGPSAANLHYSGRTGGVYTPSATGASHFFTHQQPVAAQHMAVTQPMRESARESAAPGRTFGGNPVGERSGPMPAARPAQGSQWGGRQGVENTRPQGGFENTRPQGGSQPQSPSYGGSEWRRFGEPNTGERTAPGGGGRQFTNEPRPNTGNAPSGRSESMRISPPVVHERQQTPSYSAPRQAPPSYSAPRESAPRQSAPSYSAPRESAPRQSAPSGGGGGQRSGGGGGGNGGGGGHPSGGGSHSGGGGGRR
jgi:hypothetical protein